MSNFASKAALQKHRALILWALAAALCLALYWPGLRAWFQQDDFAWLGLWLSVETPRDILREMFEPRAQGTIRPWSERGFFMAGYALFGLDALPFRIWVFLTQFVNLALLGAIAKRVTGSTLVGALAPIFWFANAALGIPMSWTSAYNQILCATCLMGAFYCLLRWIETDNNRWYIAQWAIFLFGFGALEINVVYPALAAAYTFLASRRHFRATLPLFAASAAFAIAHRLAASGVQDPTYRMFWNPAWLVQALGIYWRGVFGSTLLPELYMPAWITALGWLSPIVLTVALFSFTGQQIIKSRWTVLFPLLWFLAVISPVLPLKNHVSEYYNTIPSIGIALLGAWAFAEAFAERSKQSTAAKTAAIACAALYLITSASAARAIARYNFERSQGARNLVLSVQTARQLHPNKVILLTGVSTERFWAAINDLAFRMLDIHGVYLAPGSEQIIQEFPGLGDVHQFILPPAATLGALRARKAVVYDAAGPRLRNITPIYAAQAAQRMKPEISARLDAGTEDFAGQLGEGWFQLDGGHRWMAKRASFRLAAPKNPAAKLFLHGYCAESQLSAGPLHLKIFIDGDASSPRVVKIERSEFHAEVPLDPALTAQKEIRITLEVDRTISVPGEERELGLAFGSFAIR